MQLAMNSEKPLSCVCAIHRHPFDNEALFYQYASLNVRVMHQFKLQRSTIAVGLACAAVLTLSGCAATSITGSTAVPAAEASAKKMKAEPVKISMPVVDAFRGSGIFFFDDNVRSRLYISDAIAVNGRLPLKEEAPRGVAKGFTWGAGAATILRNGEPQPLTSPQALSVEKSGNVRLHYPPLKAKNAKPMSLSFKTLAYDLSGSPYWAIPQNPSGQIDTCWLAHCQSLCLPRRLGGLSNRRVG